MGNHSCNAGENFPYEEVKYYEKENFTHEKLNEAIVSPLRDRRGTSHSAFFQISVYFSLGERRCYESWNLSRHFACSRSCFRADLSASDSDATGSNALGSSHPSSRR